MSNTPRHRARRVAAPEARKAAKDQAARVRERCTAAAEELAAYARESSNRLATAAANLAEIRRRLTD